MSAMDNLNCTIDCIYKKVLHGLTRELRIVHISKYLAAEKDSYTRVQCIYDILTTYRLIPLAIKIIKCENVSTHYRNLGNKCYQRKDNYLAWQHYNMALLQAPTNSESYSLAISNRSALFCTMKHYKACLEDIKTVFSLICPDKLREKLMKRKRLCEDLLKVHEDPDAYLDNERIDEIFKINGPKNYRYPSASTKLQVKHTKELGRHVVAKKDIEVGEVLVQEDPYIKVLLKSQYLFACAHCQARKLNLYPCPFCIVSLYCSQSCVEQAWDEYHRYECPLIASLVKMNFTKLELLALRITIKARTEHADWESVFNTIANAESTIYTNYWGHVQEGGKWVYDSKYYPAIHTLATNEDKRDISDIFQKTVSAAILMHLLSVANFAKDDDDEMKLRIKKFTADSLLRHLMTAPINMHGITTNVENLDGNYVEEYNVGCAAYPYLSLINHSCSPNVVRYSRLGSPQMYLIALRPIKKGMEIVDNYGYEEVLRGEDDTVSLYAIPMEPTEGIWSRMAASGRKQKAHHAVHTTEERHAILTSQYKFLCLCEACVDDWPQYQDLKVIPDLPPAIASKKNELLSAESIEALQKADKKHALKSYKPLCELATALEPYIPCKEAAECQEALKQCLAIFAGVLPKEYNRFVEWEIPPNNVPGVVPASGFYIGYGARDLS